MENNRIKINELQTELKKVFNYGYGETISLKFNLEELKNDIKRGANLTKISV